MSYMIENEEMGFLNKLVDTLDAVEKENQYLSADTYDVPRSTDRYPYTEDDEVEDYPFGFMLKEVGFTVKATNRPHFALKITEESDSSDKFTKKITLTMKESEATLKKMWEDLIKEIEQKLNLGIPPRYFYDKWASSQRIAFRFRNIQRETVIDNIYQELVKHIDPATIEERIAEQFRKSEYSRDLSVESKLAFEVDVELHQFFRGEWFIVLSGEKVFLYKEKEEALARFKEEVLANTAAQIDKDIEKFKR